MPVLATSAFSSPFHSTILWIVVIGLWVVLAVASWTYVILGFRSTARHLRAVGSAATTYVDAMNDPALPLPVREALDADGSKLGDGAATILDFTYLGTEKPEFNLVVDQVFPNREIALASIAPDGVNPLPGSLLDMGTFPATLTRLTYDPVAGMSAAEPLELDGGVDHDVLAEYLGHHER